MRSLTRSRRERMPHATRVRPHTGTAAWLLSASLLCTGLAPLHAAGAAKDFADLSLEELMNESVTSVSKKEQRRGDAAAAIAVLSSEDLRRAGATSIPEALRAVPGLNVAAANAREWAVSARGFSHVFSNKLLVLVDGRAVYTPLFAGVYWDHQQVIFEDLDRIEVIRGPGATIWGANAVNGVINVVSRSARETQGGLVYGGGGDVEEALAGVRYGGRLDDQTYYRVFASYRSSDDYPQANGQPAGDGWDGRHGGFRIDRFLDEDAQLTWQADASAVDFDRGASDSLAVNTLGRWTRTFSSRSSMELQVYYDRVDRTEIARSKTRIDTFDVAAQHTLGFGASHDVVWGFGYRTSDARIQATTPAARVRDGRQDFTIFNAFAQDDFKVVPDRLTLTAGVKLEHNSFTKLEVQPSVRAVFKPAEQQTLWGAISRAVRTPSVLEGRDVFAIVMGAPEPGPGGGLYLPTLFSDGRVDSEVLWAYELGYRAQPTKRFGVELNFYLHDYSGIIGPGDAARFIPGVPLGTKELLWGNYVDGTTRGAEAALIVSPSDAWRLTLAYTTMDFDARGSPAALSNLVANPPRHQVSLRSAYDFTRRASFDAGLRYVDGNAGVPAYVSADVRLSYRPNERLELAVVGRNLLDPQHPEQPPIAITTSSEVPRGIHGKITWRF